MSDLKAYVNKRKENDKLFSEGYESGYDEFKIGVELRQMREESGLTQSQLAEMLHTQKSAISRIENHAEDIRLSTLFKIAHLLGKHVQINFV